MSGVKRKCCGKVLDKQLYFNMILDLCVNMASLLSVEASALRLSVLRAFTQDETAACSPPSQQL